MQIFLELTTISALLYVMYVSAEYLVASAAAIAKHFKVSDLIIGLTIVAMGTSAPEMVSTISASLKGSGELAVSNIVGSNIYNLGIILGIVAFFSYIKITKHILYRDVLFLLLISVFQFFAFSDGVATQIEGIISLLIFGIWFILVFQAKDPDMIGEIEEEGGKKSIWTNAGILLLALVFLLGSGHLMVEIAVQLATSLGVSEWLIGMLIIGVGTSTPELITSIVAIRKGSHGMSIGNLFGSDIFNQGMVLGVAMIITPIASASAKDGFLFIAGYILFLMILMRRRWQLSKIEGVIILTIISLRFAWEIWRGIGI